MQRCKESFSPHGPSHLVDMDLPITVLNVQGFAECFAFLFSLFAHFLNLSLAVLSSLVFRALRICTKHHGRCNILYVAVLQACGLTLCTHGLFFLLFMCVAPIFTCTKA